MNESNFVQEDSFALISEIPMKQAVEGKEADESFNAMAEEMKSILKNDTWELVTRPNNMAVIGSRIVLRNKYAADGSLEKRKARLVAQGFSQRPGIHFDQTFAPVARQSSVRTFVSLATRFRMSIRHFDVTTAYLNGDLEEEIYMEPSKLMNTILNIIIDHEDLKSVIGKKVRTQAKLLEEGNKVCKLKKALYGLRQAGRSWHLKLDAVLKSFGATPTSS